MPERSCLQIFCKKIATQFFPYFLLNFYHKSKKSRNSWEKKRLKGFTKYPNLLKNLLIC